MGEERPMWGVHLEWDDGASGAPPTDIAIGAPAMGDLKALPATREAFKTAFSQAYPEIKPGSVRIRAGMRYRFAVEMQIGDVVVYPARWDRMVHIGLIAGDYEFRPQVDAQYPHRRRVDWKVSVPRTQFSQAALYEIGSAIALFQITSNAEEFLAALEGSALEAPELDAASEQAVATQVEENVEDFILKRLMSGLSHEQFEQFIAELLRCMGYHARVTRYTGDGGVDIIAHKDELGFEPPIIKVQCKHTVSTIGGPDVQRLLGAVQRTENALFVTLGDYSADARHIERNNSHLRLIGRTDLVGLIFAHYEKFDPRFKALLPLKRTYTPSISSE